MSSSSPSPQSATTANTLLNPTRWLLITVAIAAALVLGLLAAHSWLAARDAVAQLTATITAQKKLIDQATQREAQRDATAAKAVKSITQAKAAVRTPAQAAAQIAKVLSGPLPQGLPQLPQPLKLALPDPAPDDPAPAATATIPAADLQPIYEDIQTCRICQTKLSAATADLTDERAKNAALTAERNAATKAIRGGTFWTQLKNSAKWLIIGAAAGALAAKTIPTHPH